MRGIQAYSAPLCRLVPEDHIVLRLLALRLLVYPIVKSKAVPAQVLLMSETPDGQTVKSYLAISTA